MSKLRQEPENVRARLLVRPVLIAVAFGVAGLVTAWAITPSTRLRASDVPRGPLQGVDRDPIESTARGMQREREARDALDRWEWVDRDGGLARIPIDHAIDLVVAGARAPAPDEEDEDED